ncbi:MAG: hypothetical protein ACRD8Z_22620, partial [Nitrososphaeraceae archaeon]
ASDSSFDVIFIDEEFVDLEREQRFAELREAWAKKTDEFGNKTYEDAWDNMTPEEIDYYKKKNLETSPADRYQDKKHHWYFHKSSWYMSRANGYDGYGCNNHIGIPECRLSWTPLN